jgi:hypothetical protein
MIQHHPDGPNARGADIAAAYAKAVYAVIDATKAGESPRELMVKRVAAESLGTRLKETVLADTDHAAIVEGLTKANADLAAECAAWQQRINADNDSWQALVDSLNAQLTKARKRRRR